MKLNKPLTISIITGALLLTGGCSNNAAPAGQDVKNAASTDRDKSFNAACEASVSKAEKLNAEFPEKLEEVDNLIIKIKNDSRTYWDEPGYPQEMGTATNDNEFAIAKYRDAVPEIATTCESKEDAAKIDSQIAEVEKYMTDLDKQEAELNSEYEGFMTQISSTMFDKEHTILTENLRVAKEIYGSDYSNSDVGIRSELEDAIDSAERLLNQSVDPENFDARLDAAISMRQENAGIEHLLVRAEVAYDIGIETGSEKFEKQSKSNEQVVEKQKPVKKATPEDLKNATIPDKETCEALNTLTEDEGEDLKEINKNITDDFIYDCGVILFGWPPLEGGEYSHSASSGTSQNAPATPEYPVPDQPSEADLRGGE